MKNSNYVFFRSLWHFGDFWVQWWRFGGGVESVAGFGGGRSAFGLWVAGLGLVVADWRGSRVSWFLGHSGF